MSESTSQTTDAHEPEASEPFDVTADQRRGARRTALFFVGLVLLMSFLTILARIFGW